MRQHGISALLVLASFLVSCDSKKPQRTPPDSASARLEDYNVVVILVDTLRPDHLGLYGYGRDTSPFLDSLGNSGIVFEEVYSSSSYTREAISALFTAQSPSTSGSFGWKAAPNTSVKTLGAIFKDARYKTGFFVESPMIRGKKYVTGFDEVHNFGLNNTDRQHAPKLTQRALRFVKENVNDRFMMYVHYLDPHGEYFPPRKYAKKFADRISKPPILLYGQPNQPHNIRMNSSRFINDGFAMGDPRYDEWVSLYDAEILYVDDAIRMLVEGMEELGVLNRTLVVITSDHGEEFLEHGYVEHAWTLYEESIKIPLIFFAPNALPVRRIPGPVSIIDVLPTIAALMNLEYDSALRDGSPRFRLVSGKVRVLPNDRPIVAESHIDWRNSVVALIEDDWKYIAWYAYIAPSDRPAVLRAGMRKASPLQNARFPLRAPIVKEELYDLSHDPREARDVSGENPEKLFELRAALEDYKVRAEKRRSESPQEQRESGTLTPEDVDSLKSLGYLE